MSKKTRKEVIQESSQLPITGALERLAIAPGSINIQIVSTIHMGIITETLSNIIRRSDIIMLEGGSIGALRMISSSPKRLTSLINSLNPFDRSIAEAIAGTNKIILSPKEEISNKGEKYFQYEEACRTAVKHIDNGEITPSNYNAILGTFFKSALDATLEQTQREASVINESIVQIADTLEESRQQTNIFATDVAIVFGAAHSDRLHQLLKKQLSHISSITIPDVAIDSTEDQQSFEILIQEIADYIGKNGKNSIKHRMGIVEIPQTLKERSIRAFFEQAINYYLFGSFLEKGIAQEEIVRKHKEIRLITELSTKFIRNFSLLFTVEEIEAALKDASAANIIVKAIHTIISNGDPRTGSLGHTYNQLLGLFS